MKKLILPLLAFAFSISAFAIEKDDISQPVLSERATFHAEQGNLWFEVSTVNPVANNQTAIIIPDGYNSQTIAFSYDGLWDEDAKVRIINTGDNNPLTQTSMMGQIETISIGKYIEKITGKVFAAIKRSNKPGAEVYTFSSLKSITINATTPPDVTGCSFDGFDKANVVLFVPEESVAAYKASDLAQHFSKVVAIGQNPDDAPGTGTAVDNNEVEESFTVVGRQIRLNGVQRVQVYNLTGSLVLDEVTDEATIEGNGVFIVRTATQTEKVSCR